MSLKVLPQKCEETECPSHRRCHDVASALVQIGEPPTDQVDLVFVGDIPFEDDIKKHRAFSAYSISFMQDVIGALGFPTNGYGFTSLLRCRPTDRDGSPRRPDQYELNLCRQHLERDLALMKPKVLICHGLPALRSLVPAYDHPKLKFNKFFDVEIGGKRYTALAIIKTHEVLNSTSLIPHYIEGITKAMAFAELGKDSIQHPSRWAADPTIHYCDSIAKIEEMVEFLLHGTKESDTVSFDVETRNLNSRYGNELVTLQFCVDPTKEVWVVPYKYRYGPFMETDLLMVKALIKRLFTEKPNFKYWLTHFGVFEQQQVMEFITDGVTFKNAPMVDIMALAYIIDENRVKTQKMIKQGLSLKVLASEYLGRDTYDSQVLADREAGSLYKAKPEDLIPYAAEDVINTSLLYRYLRLMAKTDKYLDKALLLATNVFAGAFRLFAKIKRNGFFADLEHLRVLASKVSPIVDRMNEIEKELKALPNVQKANAILAKRQSGNQKAIFGTPWVFKLKKKEHLTTLFFEVMGLKPIAGKKKKKTKGPSIDKLFYEAYAGSQATPVPNPIKEVALVQEHTGFKKLATGYTRKIIKLIDPNSKDIDHATDCRVRANFGFTDTVTGRPNCTGPNIQNVPRADTPTKASVKSMYCAQQSYGAWRPGKKVERVLMQLDYSAAEVRWWALISGDKILAEILRNGRFARMEYRKNPTPENKAKAEVAGDIHMQTARLMFPDQFAEIDKKEKAAKDKLKKATTDEEKKALEKILKACKTEGKDLRQNTKAIVFALIYGGGPSLIAQRIQKEDDLPFVKQLCKDFADRFPSANRWLRWIEGQAKEQYFVESPIGRRRRLPEYLIDAETFRNLEWTHASASRLARNAPIQGVASDGCIIGATFWLDYIEEHGKDWKIVNIVHDSCVTEIPIEDMEEAARAAEKCFTVKMMNRIRDIWGVDFICPLEVDLDFGVKWGSMKKMDWNPEEIEKMKVWLAAGGEDAKG